MKNVAVWAVLATTLWVGAAHANGWFPGQTGQYHLIPNGQDVQKLTLTSSPDPSCPAGLGFVAVDEYGHVDTVPFVVPSLTVFLLTDAVFIGNTGSNVPIYAGYTPWFNIGAEINQTVSSASFLANQPLVGKAWENFAGQGSLASGAAFAANSKLCGTLGITPSSYPSGGFSLQTAVLHGTLIDNFETKAPPYFTW